ncbi:hypothetical protein TanjilG_31821 [Lupinus angustifolius]|uniref:C2H2-type domain-containing protein n=2 Tax=Lupinus angustifolius TaxID=3871 RepID=A0A1J7GSE8_LUPAN|nr:PREDICTED: protein SHOOT GRAVITROPISM 5-like isoform X2 [Lupinus angustifolius]OIW03374.1 hypothetical protein TanjilG_31821 [Lupinus angustifolius]
MLVNNNLSSHPSSDPFSCSDNGTASSNKRRRRPAGTPDPDAEVVSLSPKTLLESDRYVCEICNQGFQRDQNLQMHRRRHKVPWKLLKRETPVVKKRVFVCPEPSCLHHDPCHALGDLVGIKKHFRRKHSNHKQWVCERCSKGYAVQSDYKAHLKTCGTRGHSCDCGRVFSRVESFIEHQDACKMGSIRQEPQPLQGACFSRTASSPSPSSETNFSTAPWPPPSLVIPKNPLVVIATQNRQTFLNPTTTTTTTIVASNAETSSKNNNNKLIYPNLDLQLSTATPTSINHVVAAPISLSSPKNIDGNGLQLSIGSSEISDKSTESNNSTEGAHAREQAHEELRIAMAEKAYAEEARKQAKAQIELAELEFTNAKRIRQQAQAELNKAYSLKQHAIKQINAAMLQITCHSCKQQFQALSNEGGQEEKNGNGKYLTKTSNS